MKNSKEYSEKIQKLYRSLKRKYKKPEKPFYEDPLDAIVYAIISENLSKTAFKAAMKKFDNYFVDLNDLRVSRVEEIVEMLGDNTEVTRNTAISLTSTLRAVFDKYNVVSLIELTKTGKRPARHSLEKLSGLSNFAIDYCVLTSLKGHAIPLTAKMLNFLRGESLVHPKATEQEIEGFLTKQIPAKNGYEFYIYLLKESESYKSKGKKKVTEKSTTKTKKKAKEATKKSKKTSRKRKSEKKTRKSISKPRQKQKTKKK